MADVAKRDQPIVMLIILAQRRRGSVQRQNLNIAGPRQGYLGFSFIGQ
jgi:hypothetical protein